LVELEAAQLPRALPDVEAAVINANYALDAGLHPLRDGWTHEGRNSGYANVLAVKRGRERDAQVLVLSRLLHSETVTSFLNGRYQGAVIPVF
jgi:D-methionine transport system substrate-binding protein